MQNKTGLAAVLLALALAGASAANAKPGDAEVEKAIGAASAALKKADSVGFAWRDTGKLIKSAQAAADKGDTAQAMALAEQARKQGESAYQQYLDQRNAGPRF